MGGKWRYMAGSLGTNPLFRILLITFDFLRTGNRNNKTISSHFLPHLLFRNEPTIKVNFSLSVRELIHFCLSCFKVVRYN